MSWALLAAGLLAVSDPVAVVNLGADIQARARLRPAAERLDSQLAARRLGAELPASLRAALEGELGPPPFVLDLGPARAAYASFEYERAAALLSTAESEVLARAAVAQLVPAMAEVYLLRGVLAVAQRDRAALRSFALVQRLEPGVVLDPARHSPPVRAAFAAARAGPAERGTLVVETRSGAEMLIDGGAAALPEAPLEAGLHLLVIQSSGSLRHAEVIDVQPGAPLSRRIELQPEPPEATARRLVAEGRGALARLGESIGVKRLLLVEETPSGPTARLLDLRSGQESPPATLAGESFPAQIDASLQPPAAPLSAVPPAVETPAPAPLYKRWWLWTAIGVALAATTATIYVTTRPHQVVCCGNSP
jgi:hypothetical protein